LCARLYDVPQIPYLRLRFTLLADTACSLAPRKGSMLRGAFGNALRRTVCVMPPKQACEPCMLRRQCVYTRLFETLIDGPAPRFLRGLPTAPRPYIFEPFDLTRDFAPDKPLRFDLALLGQAAELFPYAIYAVDRMAQTGLTQRRHRFHLDRVDWHAGKSQPDQDAATTPENGSWRKLYDGADKRLLSEVALQTPGDGNGEFQGDCVQLRFLTPTRLKFKDELKIDFTFRMLVFKMLRRVLELAHFHVPEARVDWEFHDLLVAADEVEIVQRDLNWCDWVRRSNRQNTTMKMGGFTGSITLQGPLAPFAGLLKASELVHVGKGAVFGNGKVGVK